MVFSDTGDLHGGFYDNNSGVDYHVPIRGSTVRQPPLRIAHVSVEMAPIAKVHTSSVVSLLPCLS
jgi:starch synthase